MEVLIQPIDSPFPSGYDASRPWDRQPCDVGNRWPLFRGYLLCGPMRAMQDYAIAVHVPYSTLVGVASECHWSHRVMAYDKAIHDAYHATVTMHVVQQARDNADRYVRMLDDALEIAEIEFGRLLVETKARSMSGTLPPRDLIRLVERALKLRLLLTGGATERIEIARIDDVLRDMPVEELQSLQSLQERLLCNSIGELKSKK